MPIISLVLRAKENDLIEFHPSQLGKRLYPYRDGSLVGFWTSLEDAKRGLASTPIVLPLMEMFDVGFADMEDIHADLAGKPLAMVEMMTEPPNFPFNLVYEVSPADVAALTPSPSSPASGAQRNPTSDPALAGERAARAG